MKLLIDILLKVSSSLSYLTMAWMIMLLLEIVWSGMAKFLKIILFPGRVMHIISHYLVARFFGIRTYVGLLSDFFYEKTYTGFFLTRRIDVKIAIFLSLSPLLISLPTCIILQMLLPYVKNYVKLLVAWLIISMWVCGMPNTRDLRLLILTNILRSPEIIFAIGWSILVFLVGTVAFGFNLSIVGTIIYLFSVLLVAALSKQEEIVIDE